MPDEGKNNDMAGRSHGGASTDAGAIGARISEIAAHVGGKKALAARAGVSESHLYRYIAGASEPTAGRLVALARAGGVSVAWLATGEGALEVSGTVREAGPRYAAGEYTPIRAADTMPVLALSSAWLNAEGLCAEALVVVTASGDSMAPTVNEGDRLLVDTTRHDIGDDAVYVLRVDGALQPKRLQRDWSGGVWVRSDSLRYADQHVSGAALAALDVVGRVIWIARRV
ncbi:putative HTH-type transcriptional regulator [wastewater metagenome]|uniref:Putative HTH-type transcriptional regulator n=3 Tax=root TaxID=1 RepID=A0A5B8R9J4_9ZZZZ|nr:LexA family transcriptional regulator [Arhodomonas sp. KWT]QEA05456.1 putative HTH-type transcriptional regulator [uncultured organism]